MPRDNLPFILANDADHAQPLHISLLDRCETSLQTHIILKQLEILRKVQPKVQ